MIVDWQATPIYEQAALRYPAAGSYGQLEIPMRLTSFKPVSRKVELRVTEVPFRVDPNPNTIGYPSFTEAAESIPLLEFEGYMDTPLGNISGSFATPLLYRGGYPITYGDFIAQSFSGELSGTSLRERVEPLWFRDPYGRYYSNPKVQDFNCSYVEAVPQRQQFSLVLRLTTQVSYGETYPSGT